VKDTQKKSLTGAMWLEFLGSMYLAITLLVVVAIASIIGTVLQQNQAYADYLIKFGPFWFDIFQRLGLYDIYGSLWFLGILTFLLLSITTCIWRNAPNMLTEMRRFGLKVQKKSLQAFHHKHERDANMALSDVAAQGEALLKRHGFQVRSETHGDHTVIAAKKGSINRAGYLLTHFAMVVILVAAFVDGTFDLKFKEMLGQVKVETRNIPEDQLDPRTFLPADSGSFRGTVQLPEGKYTDYVQIHIRDGYLIQTLPFSIELKDFRIQHYPSGQPKSFESDIVIHDPVSGQSIPHTISVNHPFTYLGHTIYQASFSDGGSELQLHIIPLDKDSQAFDINSAVYEAYTLPTANGNLTLEFNDFRLYNIENMNAADVKQEQFTNLGPSITFKVRDAQGQALEYNNYMNPLFLDGRYYFVSGVRAATSEPMRYIHIPYTADGSLDRFFAFQRALQDKELLHKYALEFVKVNLAKKTPAEQKDLANNMVSLVSSFNTEGLAALERAASASPDKQGAMNVYVGLLYYMHKQVYSQVLKQEGVDISKGIGTEDLDYLDAAQEAIATLPAYGSPFLVQLANFHQVEASGLEVTRSPAKNIVYLGSVMLIAGIFIMFYIPHLRVWLWLEGQQGKVSLILAGSSNRDRRDFEQQFHLLSEQLDARLDGRQQQREVE